MGKFFSRLGFLASGRGSNMQAIIDACEQGVIAAKPCLVVSNNPNAMALDRGKKHGLEFKCVNRKSHADIDAEILRLLRQAKVDLLVLAGYMKKVGPAVLEEYRGRIINIHPALLPRHGGQGMYGIKVHQAVIDAGEYETGATVHLVDKEYDKGAIISQVVVPVSEGDTAETLAARVLEKEHELFVNTISGIVDGKIVLDVDA